MVELVLGADLGGTRTRVLVAELDGTPRGHGASGSGNILTDVEGSWRSLGQAVGAALDGLPGERVRAAVLGVAGGSLLADPDVRTRFDQVLADRAVPVEPKYVADLSVAFAAGTPAPSGSVLVAGTGSVAGVVEERRLMRSAGGRGWLLGDEGSGFWIGREAVRAALQVLERRDRLTGLAGDVADQVLAGDVPSDPGACASALVGAAVARPPVRLADLAPLVSTAAANGDPVASAIVDRAALQLTETLARARPAQVGPLVLSGGLLLGSEPVRQAVLRTLPPGWADRVALASPGELGAVWLALERVDPALLTDQVREALTAGLP